LGDALCFTDDAFQNIRLAEYAWEAIAARPFFTQQYVLGSESRLFEGAFDEQQQMIRVDGFLKEVVSAVFHCLDGFVDGAEGGHHNHGHVRVGSTRCAQNVETGAVRHAQIGKHEAVTGVSDLVERRSGVNGFHYTVSGILEG
jgi:hypothetical protein